MRVSSALMSGGWEWSDADPDRLIGERVLSREGSRRRAGGKGAGIYMSVLLLIVFSLPDPSLIHPSFRPLLFHHVLDVALPFTPISGRTAIAQRPNPSILVVVRERGGRRRRDEEEEGDALLLVLAGFIGERDASAWGRGEAGAGSMVEGAHMHRVARSSGIRWQGRMVLHRGGVG
ncbi:hypothetical protein B0H14DRAFT_2790793 [Mycena olivaceomarginata]|nr:hypothetical protein B0H14DRAFT_2790793 [Mycena olivaceomarginata]